MSHGAGCACKMPPGSLAEILKKLPLAVDSRILTGLAIPDDAGVFRLRDDLALVFTADFFTPIVDDPYDYGRIAAVNALSDVYAMGAAPLIALNLLAFPKDTLPIEIAERILCGGMEAAKEAGCAVIGGHSINDPAPKYGMAVVGQIHPDRIHTKAGAKPGDVLVLTKPLGTGLISTAIKADMAEPEQVKAMIASAGTLNKEAMEAALAAGVNAMTDVTGFGLLGHLAEMLSASGLSAEIKPGSLPQLPGVMDLIGQGMIPAGSYANFKHVEPRLRLASGINRDLVFLAADAQTSGGLLISLPERNVKNLMSRLSACRYPGWIIGRIVEDNEGIINMVQS